MKNTTTLVVVGVAATDIGYYSRENCQAMGFMPDWSSESYSPLTHFEKLFKSPLSIDLMTSGHGARESGFEQVTADWGCEFDATYGSGGNAIGFFGPGAKDPAGGGCPKGPVRVYEDLTCALRLGLAANPNAFSEFCSTSLSEEDGMFECLSFFANVLTETGDFAETEERDPRPYCWDRSDGNSECCPAADHKPCMPDSDKELSPGEYPSNNDLWLGDKSVDGKCCSYHGRGFLQVSYEPNYKALSKDLYGDETVLWHHPYKLDSDGVAGWSAALWYWFNPHPAQVANVENPEEGTVYVDSPRKELLEKGFPATINLINGAECSGDMDPIKAQSRVSHLIAIAHRLGVSPPGETGLGHYPVPGSSQCSQSNWCRKNFIDNKDCPVMSSGVDCLGGIEKQYLSTPMGWDIEGVRFLVDGKPTCQFVSPSNMSEPVIVSVPQQKQNVFNGWEKLLDYHTENVCQLAKNFYYPTEATESRLVEGKSGVCQEMCWKDFSWDVSQHGTPCEEPATPCHTVAEYVSRPLPLENWESGSLGDYRGRYLGRVGPGLVRAINENLADEGDDLCYWFGATQCFWNTSMNCCAPEYADIHNCRVYPAELTQEEVHELTPIHDKGDTPPQYPIGVFPEHMAAVVDYYNPAHCDNENVNGTLLQAILPNGPLDIDMLFSMHYSQSDGFSNLRYDNFDDESLNKESILYGSEGPNKVWNSLLCAYDRGIPSDPDYFKRKFLRRVDSNSTAPFTEDEIRFAKLEFIAFGANMIKETGALSQPEERDPRCYCNYQGGSENKCCPNEWGNSPRCPQIGDSLNSEISEAELAFGTTTHAECCSYHGRGYLQVSYEYNYGTVGAVLFYDPARGVTADMGRQYFVNYPQALDAFGPGGWAMTLAYWLEEHPCQYCEGRDIGDLDFNSKKFSCHTAMQHYDEPGYGFGMAVAIIHGDECESGLYGETDLSMMGSQMRLSLFYSLAYRMNVFGPGENTIVPLPGTKECQESAVCRNMFAESDKDNGLDYKPHSGACWALTTQPEGSSELSIWCRAGEKVVGTSKFGARLDTVSFSLKNPNPGSCEMLHEFKCGIKRIDPVNRPSMFEHDQLKAYTVGAGNISDDYTNEEFLAFMGMGPSQLCDFVVDTNPTNNYPSPPGGAQDCKWWCNAPSGAASCASMDPNTCELSGTGLNFVNCANNFFTTSEIYSDCRIEVPEGWTKPTGNPSVSTTTTTTPVSDGTTGLIGSCGYTEWSSSDTYGECDYVCYNDTVYVAKWYAAGNIPTNGDPWALLVDAPHNCK